MVRQELTAALDGSVLPSAAGRSLQRLLDDATLRTYVRVARTGALRSRLVNGEKPPTAKATNTARQDCLDLIREAAGLPPLLLEEPSPVELRPTPGSERLRILRRRLGDEVSRILSPGHARFVAVLAIVLDTRARAGELVAQRVIHLSDDRSRIRVVRKPQHGTGAAAADETVALSSLGKAALAQWLPFRAELTEPLQGSATALWVSLSHNHAGAIDEGGRHRFRMPGMPLQQRGLIRSYNSGRQQYGLAHLLPPKLEQLRRALEDSG